MAESMIEIWDDLIDIYLPGKRPKKSNNYQLPAFCFDKAQKEDLCKELRNIREAVGTQNMSYCFTKKALVTDIFQNVGLRRLFKLARKAEIAGSTIQLISYSPLVWTVFYSVYNS